MKNTKSKTATVFILTEDLFTGEKEGEFIFLDLEENKQVVLQFVETGTNLRQIVIAASKEETYRCFKKYKKYNLQEETSHLENILKWIERKAEEGFTVRMGGGVGGEDIWYEEETYYGEKAKKQLNYSDYKAELERRVKNSR